MIHNVSIYYKSYQYLHQSFVHHDTVIYCIVGMFGDGKVGKFGDLSMIHQIKTILIIIVLMAESIHFAKIFLKPLYDSANC